jgi:hypothetical protein
MDQRSVDLAESGRPGELRKRGDNCGVERIDPMDWDGRPVRSAWFGTTDVQLVRQSAESPVSVRYHPSSLPGLSVSPQPATVMSMQARRHR